MKNLKQPKPKKGTTFTGWATFNWGVCHQRVFRTRKQAQWWCAKSHESKNWENVKGHFIIVKVKCTTIN